MLISESKIKVYQHEYKGRKFYDILSKKNGRFYNVATGDYTIVNPKELISFKEYLTRREIPKNEFIVCGFARSEEVKTFARIENEFVERVDKTLADVQGRWL